MTKVEMQERRGKGGLCNGLFGISEKPKTVATTEARQANNDAMFRLLRAVTGRECIPVAGSELREGEGRSSWYVSFRNVSDGLGYVMYYDVDPCDFSSLWSEVSRVRVYRETIWDCPMQELEAKVDCPEFDWRHTFETLAGYLARRRRDVAAKDTLGASEGAWQLELAYCYAQGLAAAGGVELPALEV